MPACARRARLAGARCPARGCQRASSQLRGLTERLFSAVGIAFSSKRKGTAADTLEDLMFARANLPDEE